MTEEILQHTADRLILYPIKHDNIWKMYKQAIASFWTVEEIDLTDDLKDWYEKLTSNERYFISHILAFFASSDTIVAENLTTMFYNEIQIPEAKMFYGFQTAVEGIHSDMYGLLIDTLIKNQEEKVKLFNAIKSIPCIKKKAEWALKHINHTSLFAERLVAFILVEGLFFSGSFCSIYWLKSRGLMPGLSHANQFISRDEGLHQRFGCLIYHLLQHPLSQKDIYHIVDEAVAHEKEFIRDALPVSLIGMNTSTMCQYIEYVADMIIVDLGYEKKYNATNPYLFMIIGDLDGKSNFFERRPSEYAKANVGVIGGNDKFTIDADF
ncbi:MAG TPA: ribonucleotide-diphosphate reductase subunit beta [Candidatus Saccharimonadales bacterium]|nr:ribonucleotide-diphosphate reductase subunit beta [Candidatus Saccharimonadales bacterium]